MRQNVQQHLIQSPIYGQIKSITDTCGVIFKEHNLESTFKQNWLVDFILLANFGSKMRYKNLIGCFNPLTTISDQNRIFLYNI